MSIRVWTIPVVIAVFAVAGLVGSRHISLPTLTFVYDADYAGRKATADFTIEGVHCYGTANALRKHIAGLPGLVSLIAYGGRRRVVIEYDPQQTSLEAMRQAIEAPVMTRNGPMRVFRVISES